MATRICPYLRTVDDPGVYVNTPDATNACYALSPSQSTSVELEFQAGTCMGGQFSRCARYKTAGEASAVVPRKRLLLLSGGVGAVVFVSVCAVLAVVALALGAASGFRLGQGAEATDTPAPIAIATLVPTMTPTATMTPTMTPTITPTPSPSPTATPTISPTTLFYSPLPTPTPWVAPTAAPWRPPATATTAPTATRTPTRTGTITPTPSRTPTGTVTSSVGCRSDDTMTFTPASPAPGQEFSIAVRSASAYADVSLVGPKPTYQGLRRDGSYYIWTWRDDIDAAGTYSYSFKIRSGASTCKTASVTVVVPTDTPTVSPTPSITPTPSNTPTPTFTPSPTPYYNFMLEAIPPTYQTIPQGGTAIFTINLKHLGNREDTYHIAAEDHTPSGWQVWFCIGDTSPGNCYAPTDGQSVTVGPSSPTLALYVKAQLPAGAELDSEESIILQVIALSNSKTDSKTVTIRVKN